jgi:outer membrane receptor for Fe3+-dicitrate
VWHFNISKEKLTMALVVPNAGELRLLDKMLKHALSTNENYILKLYSNNYTPDQASVPGSFTEANFTSYAAKTLTRANWTSAITNGSNKAETSYSTTPQSWTCGTTGQTIYGYWVEGATVATCLWAEKFTTARVLANGDVLNITPKFTLASEN